MIGDNPEVLVAGAGPVGQLAALALLKRGIDVRVVDRGLWPCAQAYALALHSASLELLDEFGLRDAVRGASVMIGKMGLYDRRGPRASVDLEAGGHGVAVVRQDALESRLEAALSAGGVKVEWRREVSRIEQHDGHLSLGLDQFEKESRGYVVAHTEWVISKTSHITTPYLVGADGYNSRVRRAMGLDFHEVGPAHYFAVFEFESGARDDHEMRLVFGDRTTDVLWPLPDGSYRWSFQLPDYHDADAERMKEGLLAAGFDFPTERSKERSYIAQRNDAPELEDAQLHDLIARRAPWFQGRVGRVTWKSIVRFERRLASEFGKGRMWLAGDAAHLTGPVGIQSMNLGLMEASQLGRTLSGILRNAESPDNLSAYNQHWKRVWRQLHNIEGGLRPAEGADPWVAALAPVLTSCLPAYGESLASLARQIKLTLA